MKINIASFGGRSHLLDLARELEKFGHEVRFYSFVPTKRAMYFGLKKENNSTYLFWALPFIALMRFSNYSPWSEYIFRYTFDHLTAWFCKPCDVFIGHSPMHDYSLRYVKKKYNAVTILERGTSHVLTQVKALSKNPILEGKSPMPDYYIQKDLSGYNNADFISIASDHVRKSFESNGYPTERLFVNPYGVSLSDFGPTELTTEISYDLILVGQWSYRKGSDILAKACLESGLTLLHVGPLVDVEFPKNKNMHHVDSVDQKLLIEYYKKAKVFVLPSREEGLALVQMQAILCGLPVVCSKHTGGRDLRRLLPDPKWIIEMNDLSVKSLISSIKDALKLASTQSGLRAYADKKSAEENLSWASYGKRYNEFLSKLVN